MKGKGLRGGAGAAVALLAFVSLAGCGGGSAPPGVAPPGPTEPPIEEGKGAIRGILWDDETKPLAFGLILLSPAGLTVRSSGDGSFEFRDVEPGLYTLAGQVEGHEPVPQPIQVTEGQYTEAILEARRIVNEGTQVQTSEFTVFIPCSVSAGAAANFGCLDASGDNFRAGVTVNYTGTANITYLVVEMVTQDPGYYDLILREDNGSPSGGEVYARNGTGGGRYAKAIVKPGEDFSGGNTAWLNDKLLASVLFYRSDLAPVEANGQSVNSPGAKVAAKGQIVHSLFLGPPEQDILSYCLLCPPEA